MKRNKDIIREAFGRHTKAVDESMRHILPDVEQGAALIMHALRRGKKVLVCGNGGSAADSQHFAAELVGRYKAERRGLPAIALTVDTSALTAIGNDYGFENIFKRQIEALGAAGDVLVAFSTGGKSKNILAAVAQARKQKLSIIILTGANGTRFAKTADTAIVVPTTETARIQEVHELVYHAWCEYIDLKHV
ncbi:MAG: SIS domain-containing protein [bacterium]|nr:SIS domain-containing protein [bacterium]